MQTWITQKFCLRVIYICLVKKYHEMHTDLLFNGMCMYVCKYDINK